MTTVAARSIAAPPRHAGSLRTWAPPFRRREFWVVQGMVVSIAIAHALLEALDVMHLDGADFLPVSLYLLPVVYAALSFGFRGSVQTAVWSVLLTIPNVVLWHEPASALGDLWQAALVLGVGTFVGQRVEREREARERAEARERERRASDARYRGLFTVAADPILVLDQRGVILDANAAATQWFGERVVELRGASVDSLVPAFGSTLNDGPDAGHLPVRIDAPGRRAWVDPVAVTFVDAEGLPRVLAQLRDVTPAVERQQLLEGFARQMVAAREEERRRVARDLHDGPLQSLMLLSRSLDEAQGVGRADAPALLVDAQRQAEDVADDLRRFSRELRPSILDDLGLAAALKAEAGAFARRTGLAVAFQAKDASARLPAEVEITLLRICQEALRNIERHAKATSVSVVLERRAAHYQMTVADDGTGLGTLPPASVLVGGGRLGVVGMQERARLIGAMCKVQRRSGEAGTMVEVVGSATPESPSPGTERTSEGWAAP